MNWEKIIDGHIIVYSEYKYKNKQYNIEMFLKSDDFKIFLTTLDNKYIIVIGWDGTMLSAIRNNYSKNIPFLWINFGNKWFLLQDKSIILEKNNFIEKKYSLFDVFVNWEKKSTFINEINISALNGKMWEFQLNIGKTEELKIKSDWLVVSSPLGSTAYNSSLWWPLLSHHSKSIVITWKAVWGPKHLPSIVTNENDTITIKNSGRFHWLNIFTDGIEIKNSDDLLEIVIKKSEHNLIFSISENQESNWNNKIFKF